MNVPSYPAPTSLKEWARRRKKIKAVLEGLLGDLPPPPGRVRARVLRRESRRGYGMETLLLEGEIPCTLLLPPGMGPFPAILDLHWHGEQYALGRKHLFRKVPGGKGPRGPELARRGYAVLSPDAHGFGDRQGLGPGGPKETGKAEEMSLSKLSLWRGRTLWGMIVRDDRIALDYLAARPEIDARRIGATGFSMGSTRTWWLAALDDRIAAAVGVCCLTRYQDLVRERALAEHGIYYFVPGMLRHFDSEAVASLIAPRPFLTLSGGKDGGSPASGVRKINAFCSKVYRLHRAPRRFRGRIYPTVGHVYTPAMWTEMVAWFDRHLQKS